TEEVGGVTSKKATFDVPPSGPGLTTVTEAVRAVAISESVMFAVSFDVLTDVVGVALPFQCTTDSDTKPVPLTVRVNPTPRLDGVRH
ncbi:MAG TPA: hypothetical protein VF783_24100, partial [Terriglobales bacterium]